MKPETGPAVYARMIDDIHAMFERHEGEFHEFKRILTPRHSRPDIAAFLLLHELVPEDPAILARVGHARESGKRVAAGAGNRPTEVCGGCRSWRVMGPGEPWHLASEPFPEGSV